MFNEFMKKIVIHETDKITGDILQKIAIHFNFISEFIPTNNSEILTEEQRKKNKK